MWPCSQSQMIWTGKLCLCQVASKQEPTRFNHRRAGESLHGQVHYGKARISGEDPAGCTVGRMSRVVIMEVLGRQVDANQWDKGTKLGALIRV